MTDKQRSGWQDRPTMMDVASRAGVSQATVSLVLNGSPGAKLSDATRRRVHEAANAIGYQLPKRAEKPAPSGQSVIGFIADEIATDPWMAIAFDGARKKALEFGMNVHLAVSNGNPDLEASIIEDLEKLPLVGLIYGTILTRQTAPVPGLFRHRSVLLNCYDKDRQLHSVIPGDLLGGRLATQRLIEGGRRRIGFINGQKGIDAARDRLKGYRQALASHDIPFEPSLVRSGNWEPSSGYEHTKSLLQEKPRPDAIFCANDLMALGAFDALHEAGLSVPNDISLIGFDDREIAAHTHPPLTTLLLPHYEMGSIAAENLIEMVGGHNTKPTHIKVECPLIERQSV